MTPKPNTVEARPAVTYSALPGKSAKRVVALDDPGDPSLCEKRLDLSEICPSGLPINHDPQVPPEAHIRARAKRRAVSDSRWRAAG
jgi:hypothetical protein